MNSKDIEARLDRSLENQVRAPRLGRSFDAGVWARIAREEAAAAIPAAVAAPSRALRASGWLAISNALGIAATLAVALFFALRAFGGIDASALDIGVSIPLPAISDDTVVRMMSVLSQVLGCAALAFGLSFTAYGRRIRRSFS